jgi:NAD(P)-dependent dehydrogenase (short-subunit alcohol dehydrogenase family)
MSRRHPPVATLTRRRCLITGAASGIGRATALAVARRGAELHLTDLDAAGLTETVRLIEAEGGAVLSAEPIDLTAHDRVVALAAGIHATHGSVDVVMNVAGVSTWGTIDQLTHGDWEQMIDVDLRGPISLLEAFVPPMIEAGRGGHVVNVSSAAGLLGLPWHAAYSAAKFGLRGVSEVLRFDLRRHRIGVSLVCPGGVATPLVETARIRGIDTDAPQVRALRERFARRAVSPERVAAKIIEGIERDRYLVFTSTDIRLAFLAQRYFPPAYELAMRRLNAHLTAVARSAS